MSVMYEAGDVTAYAAAKLAGYTGTFEQFCALMADYAEVGERAETAAESAGRNALKAEGNALGKQNGEDVDEESPYYHNNAVYYAGQAGTAKTDAETAKDKAETAQEKAETAQGKAEDAADIARGIAQMIYIGVDGKCYANIEEA